MDAIVISANDPDALVPICKRAMSRGFTVLSFDSGVAKAGRILHINPSSPDLIGEKQIEMVSKTLGGRGEIAILSATAQATNQNTWIKVMKKVLARRGWLDWTAMRRRAAAIARALSHEARVVIMDEPTAALSTREIEELYRIVRRLRASGRAILFISHKLDEVFAIADRYTVFRDGALVGEGDIAATDEDALVRLMVGRPIVQVFPKRDVPIGPTLLEVRGLGNDTQFEGISFSLREGEVLGF